MTTTTTGINWDEVRKELDSIEWELSMDDPLVEQRSCFLGTVFTLYPSGKYYTPWACSNVAPCPECQGRGTVPNPIADPMLYGQLKCRESAMRSICMHEFGAFTNGRWPVNLLAVLHSWSKLAEDFRPDLTCSRCDGLGSEEAHLDECYHLLLEAEAEEHDLFICAGEGDPCDLFAVETRDRT